MSEPPPEREWRFYLDDMIAFAERVIDYTGGFDQAGFESSPITYDATLRNLELIGEAATRIPQSVRDVATQIPWRQLIATRNRAASVAGRASRTVSAPSSLATFTGANYW